ncbi:MAG: LysM peptidoglycan-binding domain-containing protein [Candidatus Cyclonatronum sp.]|uniref:LysM peptidoglycan-binding domain-containing protein n=1 Tax=Cyclonatronum sp. TaxID=3024185 RepID=UPI0025C3F21D|nr:LysM peptidoglycan-binding domain-containing protein [Cyclonatronum sp.]MCH8485474.1 LysM peptidoglycan-binding domain-containing protein [Cyclonatronum sp.]
MPSYQPVMQLSALPAEVSAVQNADRRTHTVQARETLFGIARRYEVTVQNLRDWNDLQTDALREGQQLFVEPPLETSPTAPQIRPETAPAASSGTNEGRRVHTVAQGQTMFSISRQYGVSVSELQEWNSLAAPDLRIGQQLFVEAPRSAPAAPPAQPRPQESAPQESAPQESDSSGTQLELDREGPRYTYHTVRSGDTLSGIARQHGISLTELRNLNNIRGDVISIGQRLVVGREVSAPRVTGLGVESTAQGRFYTYTVQRNETLAAILRVHQMDEKDFQALNPGLGAQDIRTGLELVLLAPPTVTHRNPYRLRDTAANGNGTRDAMPATVYSTSMRGMVTTSGELYNPAHLTAAHPSLPLGSVVHLHNPDKNLGIFVLINDRTTDSRIRLSDAAFRALRLAESESPRVLIDTRTDADS